MPTQEIRGNAQDLHSYFRLLLRLYLDFRMPAEIERHKIINTRTAGTSIQ
jgi:hypothetical protein